MYVCMYVSTKPPHRQDGIQGQFLAEFNRFECKVFRLLDWLSNHG